MFDPVQFPIPSSVIGVTVTSKKVEPTPKGAGAAVRAKVISGINDNKSFLVPQKAVMLAFEAVEMFAALPVGPIVGLEVSGLPEMSAT